MESGQYGEAGNQPRNNIVSIDLVYEEEMNSEKGECSHSQTNKNGIAQKSSKDKENKNNSYSVDKIIDSQSIYPVDQNTNEQVESTQKNYSQSQLDNYEELYRNNYDLNLSHLYQGPYYAYIEHESKNAGRLHEMKIGHILHKEIGVIDSVKEISFIGINRVKIQMNSARDVHNLVLDPVIKTKGFRCYVPKHLTERRGVIKRVDTCFSEDYIVENIECDAIVKSCKRVVKKQNNPDGTYSLVPRQTVIVTFLGNRVPSEVFINRCRRTVDPYIANVLQCYNCLRFGHLSFQCRSAESRCKKCGIPHQGICENSETKCCHCQSSSHDALSKECPRYKEQKKIKEIMGERNITFKEAKTILDNPNSFANITTRNRFAALSDINDPGNFPPLPFSQPISQISRPKYKPALNTKNNHSQYKKRKADSANLSPRETDINPFNLPLTPLPPNPRQYFSKNEIDDNNIDNFVSFIREILIKIKETNIPNNDLNNIIKEELAQLSNSNMCKIIKDSSGHNPENS